MHGMNTYSTFLIPDKQLWKQAEGLEFGTYLHLFGS